MAGLSATLRALLSGNPFGEVFPPRAAPPPRTVDGRTAGLRVLRRYVSELTFFRPGDVGGQPVPFTVPESNFEIEWPDHERDVVFPMITVIPGKADYATVGLNTELNEASFDVFAPGTALQVQSEYTERLQLELWCSKKAERRALLAGLEIALSPTQQMYGVRFTMPDYYNETVCFTLWDRILMDDENSARDRRRARMTVEMRYNQVSLVNVNTLLPVGLADQIGEGVTVDVNNPLT